MARGIHGRQGPPPDPNALRRDRPGDAARWEILPAEGRKGALPAFPLADPSDRELAVWAIEWRRPQAVRWEHNRQHIEVAMYVRTLVAAELPTSTAALRVLALRQQEHLGLTLAGLARNRWHIGESVSTARPAPRVPGSKKPTRSGEVRARLSVLDGGGDPCR